jgi:hypothetical protein
LPKRLKVFRIIVWRALLPAGEHDPDPLEGKAAHGGGVFLALGDLRILIVLGPLAVLIGLLGVFPEGLMDEVWAGVATVYPYAVAATLGHRRDAAVELHVTVRFVGVAVATP